MTNQEIQARLDRFEAEIMQGHMTREKARAIEKDLDCFVDEHNLTQKQLKRFIDSGAGEVLYMLVSSPTNF